jgi:hypothetical protein
VSDEASIVASFASFKFRLISSASFFATNDSSIASSISTAKPTDFSNEALRNTTIVGFVFRNRSKIDAANST